MRKFKGDHKIGDLVREKKRNTDGKRVFGRVGIVVDQYPNTQFEVLFEDGTKKTAWQEDLQVVLRMKVGDLVKNVYTKDFGLITELDNDYVEVDNRWLMPKEHLEIVSEAK